MAGATTRDPITGEIKFRESAENVQFDPVISETSGQTASQLQPVAPPIEVAPFKVPVKDSKVDVSRIDNTNTISDVVDFRDQADNVATSGFEQAQAERERIQSQILELSQPSEALQGALDSLSKVREERTAKLDFHEDRLIDIGAIGGAQDQVNRELDRKEQTALNRVNTQLALRGQKLDALTKAYQFTQDNLDAFLTLQEMTKPEIISTDIDPQTGQIFTLERDPQTGQVTQKSVGQVTPKIQGLNFISKGTYVDNQNQQVFYGVTESGEIVQQVLGQAREQDQFGTFGFFDPKQGFDTQRSLAKDFNKVASEASDAKRQLEQMETGLRAAKAAGTDENINAASQAILVTFQKILDPTSVVRESEYARSGTGLSLIGRMEGAVDKIKQGGAGVPVEDLEDFVQIARNFYSGYENDLRTQAQITANQASQLSQLTNDQFGNLENILPQEVIGLLQDGDVTPEEANLSDEDAYQLYLEAINQGAVAGPVQ
jgi:plasmid stabilization system protein ParE